MGKHLKSVDITRETMPEHVEPEDMDMAFLVVMGVFVNENINGKFEELTFMPAHGALAGVELSISALQEAGCCVKLIKAVKPNS